MWVQLGRKEMWCCIQLGLQGDSSLVGDGSEWRKRERGVVGDLGTAVAQVEDLRAQPRAISYHSWSTVWTPSFHLTLVSSHCFFYKVAAWLSYREIQCHTMSGWQVGFKLTFTLFSRSTFKIHCDTLECFLKVNNCKGRECRRSLYLAWIIPPDPGHITIV